MSNEDAEEEVDSDEEQRQLTKKVAELEDELATRDDQVQQLHWQQENDGSKLKVVERQVREWERIATIVQGLGKDEDDLIKILKEKDALELSNEELKVKLKDLQHKIDNFDASRAEERKHAKDIETELRDAKLTLRETEDIRKQGAQFRAKIGSLKQKVDNADFAMKKEKNKTQKANQDKAKALFEAQNAQKTIDRQKTALTHNKKEMDKVRKTMDEIQSERDTLKAQWKATQEEYEQLHTQKGDLQDAFKAAEKRFEENNSQADSRNKEIELLKTDRQRQRVKLAEAAGWKSLHEIVDELAPKEEEKKALEAQKIQLRAQITKEQNNNRTTKKESAHWEEEFNKKQSNLYDVLASHKQELQTLTQDWKQKISKANTSMELEKQRADELESHLASRTQEMLNYQTELQAYKKNHKMLEIRVDDLESETSQLTEERDSMRDIVDCTQTEMTTLLGALKNMEVALDRMKSNDSAVEESKFLKEKCGSLEKQVKDYQKQLNENMDRYMKGLKEQKETAKGMIKGAKDESAAIAAAMGAGGQSLQQAEEAKQQQQVVAHAPPQHKTTAIVSKLRAERDVLKGELDRCYKSLTNTRMQKDQLELALMSRDGEIGNLRDKLQEVLRSVQTLTGLDSETTVLQGLIKDMNKYTKSAPKPQQKKGRPLAAKIADRKGPHSRGGPRPPQAQPRNHGAQQGPRGSKYGGHRQQLRGRRAQVPEE